MCFVYELSIEYLPHTMQPNPSTELNNIIKDPENSDFSFGRQV